MKKKVEKCDHEKGKTCTCPSQCYYTFECKAKDEFGYPRYERVNDDKQIQNS
jgi:hypothetical protein